MTWQERRGATTATATARRLAHSDEAKARSDDVSSLRVKLRPRWLVPAGIATAAILLGGGAAATVMGSDDGSTQGDERRPTASTGVTSGATPVVAPATTAADLPGTISPSPTGPASLVFTSTGEAVVTVANGAASRQQRTYRIDCRTGSCSVYSPIGKSTIMLTPSGPGTWAIAAAPPPTDPCDKALFGARRAAVTMTLTESTVRIVSDFAGYRLQGNGCFVNNPASRLEFTGDREPA